MASGIVSTSCFFCGETLLTTRHQNRSSSVTKCSQIHQDFNITDHAIKVWDEQCALSLCRLLNIPRGDPSASALLNIQFGKESCSSCHQLIRDIDFTLTTLLKLHEKLLEMRSSFHQKLVSKTELQVDDEVSTNDENYSSQNKFRVILQKIEEKKPEWTNVDFLSSHPHSTEVKCEPQLCDSPPPDFKYESSQSTHEVKDILLNDEAACSSQSDFLADEILGLDTPINNYTEEHQSTNLLLWEEEVEIDVRSFEQHHSNNTVETIEGQQRSKRTRLVQPVKAIGKKTPMNRSRQPQQLQFTCFHEGCDEVFQSRVVYEKHFYDTHRGENGSIRPYKCKTCGKTFEKSFTLTRHEDIHLAEEHRKTHTACSFCGAWKPNGPEIEAHESQHRSREHPFSCLLCDDQEAKYQNFGQLNRHMKESHAEHCGEVLYLFKCLQCEKIFWHRYKLDDHLREAHGDESKRHECDICGKVFGGRSRVESHKRQVHGDKSGRIRWICDICERSFSNKYFLREHMQTHEDANKFKCAICNKEFKLAKSLRRHEAIHSGLNLFKCSHCPKSFKTKSNLEHHSRTHLNRY